MLVLTDIQKQNILKYVDDKTYTQRVGCIIGVVVTIVSIVCLFNTSNSEVMANLFVCAVMSVSLVGATLKDVIRFKNVKVNLDEGSFIASKKQVLMNFKTETTQTSDYSKSLKDSHLYSGNEPPRNSKIIIQKYYIVDKYNIKYECIKYLDYKKCIEKGEFISIDFPTGEKFALYD